MESTGASSAPLIDRGKDSEPMRKEALTKSSFGSFWFEPWDAPTHVAYTEAQPASRLQQTSVLRWLLLFLIGALTALVAVAVKFTSQSLSDAKFRLLTTMIAMERSGRAPTGVACAVFIAVSLALVLVGGFLASYVEPASAGSGIPEVKCILNGINLPRVLRAKTLFCKAVGNAFSVAAGLPIGAEGPLVHSGAIIGTGVTQGKSTMFGFDTRFLVMRAFRNDAEKRDFIACGAASGVAAAFGAPVGGLLFAIEESLTHWSRSLLYRILLCAITAAYLLDVFLSGMAGQWGALAGSGLLSFGDFVTPGQTRAWSFYELPLFIVLGVGGGLVGGAFNGFNRRLTLWRYAHIPASRPGLRLTEVLVITTLHSLMCFTLPLVVGVCKPSPTPDPSRPYVSNLQPLYCPAGQYNDLGSALMVPAEDAIKQLFHFSSPGAFSPSALLVHFFAYSTLSAITYGAAIPSGLFIPALLSGASLGRLAGVGLNAVAPAGTFVDAGIYSLIGAAAMLGGVTRMTVSLAVIVLECTGNWEYAVPLMAALVAARFVGNMTGTVGIYDLHINLQRRPLLKDHLPKRLARDLLVCDVMAQPPVTLREVDTVGALVRVLSSTHHQAFPVVFAPDMVASTRRLGARSLAGLVQRRHLAVLLARRAFYRRRPLLPSDLLQAYTASLQRENSGRVASLERPLGRPEDGDAGDEDGGALSDKLTAVANGIESRPTSGGFSGSRPSSGTSIASSVSSGSSGSGSAGIALRSAITGRRTVSFFVPQDIPEESGPSGSAAVSRSSSFSGSMAATKVQAAAPFASPPAPGPPPAPAVRLRLPSVPSFTEDFQAMMARAASDSAGGGGSSQLASSAAVGGSVRLLLSPQPLARQMSRGGDTANSPLGLQLSARGDDSTTSSVPTTSVVPAGEVHLVADGAHIMQQVIITGGGGGGGSSHGNGGNGGATPRRISRSASSYAQDGDQATPWASSAAAGLFATPPGASPAAGLRSSDGSRDGGDHYDSGDNSGVDVEPLLAAWEFDAHWPRYPDVSKLSFSSDELDTCFVDLRPYLNPTPHVVHVHAPAARAFDMFRGLGLHHLTVVNDVFDVVGVITRHNLTVEALEASVARKASRKAAVEAGV